MTGLEQIRDQPTSTVESGSSNLQEYRLGAPPKNSVEKKTDAPPAASPEAKGAATAEKTERDAVLAKVGTIPDVERPQIASTGSNDVQKEFAKAATDYGSALLKLKNDLPSHYTIGKNGTVPDLAKRVLEDRAPITGENINPAAINTEAKRIEALNPNISQPDGNQSLLVYDTPALSKLADTTSFKYVPQIGQLLTQEGVPQANVDEGLRIQNSLPKANRPLIGQILVNSQLATQSEVDQAFGQQNSLKATLKDVEKEVLGK
jgi:hypothetical protein